MINIIKIIFINIFIFFTLIGLFVFSPIVIYQSYVSLINLKENLLEINSKNTEFFNELKKIPYSYSDFVTFKYYEYKSNLINIDNKGNRFSKLSENINEKLPNFIFFGPSTIWGYGEEDEKSIPSIFSQKNKAFVQNFSSNGYTSRQSLAKLINYYIENPYSSKKRVIIFNEGAIDFYTNCNDEDKILKTLFTEKIEENTMSQKESYLGFDLLIKPSLEFIKRIENRIQGKEKEIKECTDEKIKYIASSMIEIWKIADSLVKVHGDEFVVTLTPFSYEDSIIIPSSRFEVQEYQKLAVEKGYEFIRKNIKIYSEINFIDLSKIFDSEKAYLDSMHYSFEGKEVYVEKLTEKILGRK
ncbi:hypothetical protein [Aliarcobacter butzleri]|uniref:hypothetical protein n=1 Tax=Aliarcobacter butzleri TaxID=28197 RepID=UPI003AF929C5